MMTERLFASIRGILAATLLLLPGIAGAQDLIPSKRLVLSANTDFPGGDLATIFDTTLEACERACLSNASCTAFTFNSRNNSCFPKAGAGAALAFVGAVSGEVLPAAPGAEARARARRAELTFILPWEDSGFTALAAGLAQEDGTTATPEATQLAAALNRDDSPATWAEYARLLLTTAEEAGEAQRSDQERAYAAAVNGYLRAEDPALRHTLLVIMGAALEAIDRGRDTVEALRLAQSLQPREDTALALEDAFGKYGFRIQETDIQSDSARPRICVSFSEDLVKRGVEYANYVQLGAPEQTVRFDGGRQLCVEGVQHGTRTRVTFRAGLPAANGQVLAKSVQVAGYIRDRSPGVRFAGRGYVLPRAGAAAIPVETVNTDKLDLKLYRVTDRNLLRSFQTGYFGQQLQEYDFDGQIGAEIWQGTARVSQEVNRDVTTRLPLEAAIAGQPAGVYVLRAAVPGVDPYASPAGWQWFVISDLGLTTMSGVDGLHVFVRSLGTAAARAGVRVALLSRANQVLGEATTDAAGYARFDAGLTRGAGGAAPGLVVAREGEADVAFLSLTDPEFDLSDRGVEGREAAPPVDVYLTTDRGAYRAGETVHATALARDPQAEALAGLPLTAVLYRPDGVEYSRALVPDGGAGGHVFALPIADGAPRGIWKLEMLADQEAAAVASQTFLVEDFLPERIDFDLALGDAPLRLGAPAPLAVSARYLFGAPGADLAIEGEVLVRAAEGLAAWPGYLFGRHDAPFAAQLAAFGGSRTDAQGQAQIAVDLPQIEDPERPLEARFTLRLAEGSGRPVERRIIRALAPSAPMIGVKPLFEGVVPEGGTARFALISTEVPMEATWELTRIETEYQWYQTYGNWNWEPVTTRTRVAGGSARLGAQPLEVSGPVGWGAYELSVESASGRAATSTPFFAGWYAPADTTVSPDTLELSLDRKAYRPGETAMLRIVPRAAGTALITVLSNRLVAMRAVEVVAGENLIPLAVSDEWGAGVYVTASAFRPMDMAAGRNPARALGLTHAAIDPGARALKAVIETAPEAAPRGPMAVAVKVEGLAAGDTAYATIAAVDQGILNLTGFAPPDPQGHYFGQRKLGVGIRDLYGRLIDGLNGAAGEVRSGGDAGAQARLQAPPPTEELVAYFSGPLRVGADGYARASFDLPAFNGSVKVMAVVWSAKGVGQAQADVLVRDPVVVTASLPRFLAPGDESRLLLEIVHASGPTGQMGLEVSAKGVALGEAPAAFDLAAGGKARFAVPITAGEAGEAAIDVALTTPDGRVLRKALRLPVVVNDPAVMRVSRLDLAPGQAFTLGADAFAGLMPGTGQATLAAGPIARLNAPGILAALDRSAYGCTEQITSRALPLLYFDQMAAALGLPGAEDIPQRISEAVAAVLTNQSASGGFGLWAPGDGDFWLDAYVTDFLSRARARGHPVPDTAFRQALDNLRNQVNYQADFDEGGEGLAYALMVLAREGAAAIGDLRYYADVKGDAFATPMAQAQLGAALASYGDQPRADAMFRKAAAALDARLGAEVEQILRADYGTRFRDAAAVLALAVEAGSAVIDREALTTQVVASRTLSTQEASWALLAAHALIERAGAEGLSVNGQPARGPLVRAHDAASAPLVLRNDGAGATTLAITTFGVPAEPEPAGGTGYAITRSYTTLQGAPATLEGLKAGARLVAVLEITPFGRGAARLMVNDPLPAGFEIDNPNLFTGGALAGSETPAAHSEFRQERFLTAIDRQDDAPFRLAYVVRAVSPGTFRHPAATVEDMYRPDLSGRTAAGQVTIAP